MSCHLHWDKKLTSLWNPLLTLVHSFRQLQERPVALHPQNQERTHTYKTICFQEWASHLLHPAKRGARGPSLSRDAEMPKAAPVMGGTLTRCECIYCMTGPFKRTGSGLLPEPRSRPLCNSYILSSRLRVLQVEVAGHTPFSLDEILGWLLPLGKDKKKNKENGILRPP